MKKFISILLCVCILFSACAVSVSATDNADKIAVSCQEDLKNLNRDVPVVFVNGMQGEYYKGLSTETEEDDVRIWGPNTDAILNAVKENIFSLLWNLLIGNYKRVNATAKKAADTIFGDFVCDENERLVSYEAICELLKEAEEHQRNEAEKSRLASPIGIFLIVNVKLKLPYRLNGMRQEGF